MSERRFDLGRWSGALLCLAVAACAPRVEEPAPPPKRPPAAAASASAAPADPEKETTVFEGRSAFSHFLVRDFGTTRSLYFIRDNGEIVLESAVDRAEPHKLVVGYTRAMFASHLLLPEPKSVLIVGLGGGGMVHFLQRWAPALRVDVVEIDPAIVKAADELFGVRGSATVHIVTEDAFKYLAATGERYDVIYMDAFLKPSSDTDVTGVPLRLKTVAFLTGIQKKLNPGGLVVFNLNEHRKTAEDLETIRAAFAHAYLFQVPNEGNYVVVGTTTGAAVASAELEKRGQEIDAKRPTTFSFRDIAKMRVEGDRVR